MPLLLNCDLGEGDDPLNLAIEERVMPHIHIANIACGMHAGSPAVMEATLALARDHRVRIAAHPGYPDREFFGRRSLPLSEAELIRMLNTQLGVMINLATQTKIPVEYIKPHGALYNDITTNRRIRTAVMQAVADLPIRSTLVMLATHRADEHREEASRLGLTVAFEAFADRGYDHEGALLHRSHRHALLPKDAILQQARQLQQTGTVRTVDGKALAISADTLCIHGDHPDSVAVAAQLRSLLDEPIPLDGWPGSVAT